MTRERVDSGAGHFPPPLGVSRRPRRRAGSRSSYFVVLLVLALVVLAFLQAFWLSDWLRGNGAGESPRIAEVNLPEREVLVLVSDGDPAYLLHTPTDLPEADEMQAEELDRYLFPGGERHRYWMLHVRHEGKADATVALGAADLVLIGKGGESWHPTDLAVAREHAGDLPPWLDLWLSLRIPPAEEVRLVPGGTRRVLLACPEEALPEHVASARVGGRELERRTLVKDELDRRLGRGEDDRSPD